MKKLFFAALAVAMMSLSLISCDKDDPAEGLNVNTGKTAQFKGKVLINIDETASEQKWSAPFDLKISARVLYSELGFSFDGANSKYYVIPANSISYSSGEYTIVSPVGLKGSKIEIAIDNFTGKVKKNVFEDGSYVKKDVDVIWNSISYFSSSAGFDGSVIYVTDRKLNGSTFYTEVVNPNDKI